MFPACIIRNLVRFCRLFLCQGILHHNLLDAVPEGTEIKIVRFANDNPIGVDGVVGAAVISRDANGTMIFPRPRIQGRRTGNAD